MITNFLFQLLNKFNVASNGFRKFLSIFISFMIFGLILAVYKFTKLEVANFTRNLLLLASLDIGGFFLLSWKNNKTPEPIPTPLSTQNTQPISEIPPQNEAKIERLQEIEQVEAQLNEENEVDKLMKEIIEENKEKIDEMEKEMGIQ